jgi:hypothetical protein
MTGLHQELLGVRAEVLQGPGELGPRIDQAFGEVLVGASRSEFVIAVLVPMPTGSMRIEAENLFPLDIEAKGGPPKFALQTPQGPAIQGDVPGWGQRPNQHSAQIGLAIKHRRHHHSPSVSYRQHSDGAALSYHKTCQAVAQVAKPGLQACVPSWPALLIDGAGRCKGIMALAQSR